MNNQNLKNTITSTRQARELGSKGGKSKSPKKKLAAQLREMKKKGLTDENSKRIADIISNPNFSAIDILKYLESIKDMKLNKEEKIKLVNTYIRFHQAVHGKKIQANVDNKYSEPIRFIIEDGSK